MGSPRRLVPLLLAVLAALPWLTPAPRATAQPATTVEVYATGLVNPKALAFTPDGTL